MSFWGALIVAACLDEGVETLYTEDIPSRAEFGPLTVDSGLSTGGLPEAASSRLARSA